VRRAGVALVYTHLGKVTDRREPIPPATRDALRLLASYRDSGRILVTTTRKLLDWCRRRREARVELRESGASLRVVVSLPGKEDAFDGLTLYVPAGRHVQVALNDRELVGLRTNPPDHTGGTSISLEWKRLQFPCP